MTRKKSNVKALALAVTCAILAGGGIGLKPVYAADVQLNVNNGAITAGSVSGSITGTVDSNPITNGKITDGSITSGTFTGTVTLTGNDIQTAIAGVDISKAKVGSGTTSGTIESLVKNVGDNSNAIQAVNGQVTNLDSKVEAYNTNLNTKITEQVSTLDAKINTKVNASDFSAYQVKNDKAVDTLKYNTQKIEFKKDNKVTSDNATYIDGITHAGGVRLADGAVRAKSIVLEEEFANGTSAQATLTRESIVNLHGMIDGKTKIKVADGSEVGGVTFDQGKVTNVVSINDNLKFESDGIYLNKGDQAKQIKIGTDGKIIIGTSSSAYDTNGFYAGGDDYTEAKAAIDGINGKIKGANGAFGVDDNGNVTTTGDIKGKDITVNGKLNAKGDATVGGDLSVAGAAHFAKETTFADGIKTDAINEATADKGVTIDGVWLKDKGISAAGGAFTVDGTSGNVTTTGDIQGKNITATGALKSDSLVVANDAAVGGKLDVAGATTLKDTLNVKGATTLEDTLDVKGNTSVGGTLDVIGATTLGSTLAVKGDTTVGGTLGVTGKTTLKDELQVDETATFGIAIGSQTVIKGDQVVTGRIETDATQASKIGGVTLQNGKVTATDMTVTGTIDFNNLKVNDTLTVGINTKITEGTLQLGTADDNKLTADKLANINQTIKSGKVIEANSANIGDVEIKGGNVTTTGTVQGNTISDGAGATLTGGKITAKEGKIGNVEISAAGAVTGVSEIKANTFKVDDNNFLNNNGITAKGGTIGGAVIDATTLNIGSTTLDKANGITTNKLTIGDMALTGTGLNTGTNDFQVNGVTFNQGKVTAQADKGFVAGTSSFKQDSLIVDANNKLEKTQGLTTEKATVNGTLDVTGKATFGAAGQQTTIEGDAVTTDTLKANKLILGASGAATVEVDKDGSLKAANGKFAVDKDGALKAAGGAFNVAKDGKTTFTKDADNLSSINGGNIWAKATDAADHTSSELTHDYKGLHVSGNKAGQTSAFDFDTATGISTFTGQDNSSVTINGSAIRSAKSDGTAGKLDGENLTLYKDGNNQTTMSAGKATFTGDAGEKGGKVTTINGGTISTDTLNVERINLGEDILDSNGNPHGSNLSMDKQGNFSAAGGNFKVTGGTTGSRGSITNIVGDDTTGKTAFETNQQGANMSFEKGSVKSEVSVADDSAKISAGASSIEVKDGSITNNGVTTFNGTTGTTTKIDGGTITTNHLITDKLTITGSGNADGTGSGSIAFGGNGSITSNIKDATTGKEATFKTDEKGTFTEAKDNDGNKTTNTVNAKGNTNVVTDSTNTSTATQTATSIGGVVTNGTVTMRQELNADGVKVSVDGDTANYTQITNKDVSITDQKNPGKRINLSDLGQLNDLDGELTARDEYTNNKTAVGAINAEAAIRREEVARLDNRIDDVNNRVDKVGAMAAAIASLKSIGYDPQAPSEFSIGLGQYKGETGVAMGFFHYPNKNFMINVSLSTAGGETMGGIGATWRFGHKSPQKLLEEQREAQAKKELAAAEKYQAAAKLAKEAQERAEYAAKLARQAQVSADNAKAAADATQAKHFG